MPAAAARPRGGGRAPVRGGGRGDVPAPAARPRGRRARRDLPVRVQRGQRGCRGGLPRGAHRLPRDRGHRRRRARAASTALRRAISPISSPRTPRRGARPSRGSCRHDDLLAIVGLGLLVFVHELGHFVGVGGAADAPAEVLHRLPACGGQAHPQRDRVRHRDDPARRLREDPGHAPAGAGRRRPGLRARHRGGARARGRGRPPAPRARKRRPRRRPRVARDVRRARRGGSSCRSRPRRGVEKGVADIGDALGPDAYWRARTWKRVLVIFAGPAANILFAFVLFTGLFMTSGGKATTTIDSSPRRLGRSRARPPGGRPDRLDQRRADDGEHDPATRSRARTAGR